MADHGNTTDGGTAVPPAPSENTHQALTLDVERYRGDLAELKLTPEQERELLETLWGMMAAFVDLGFSSKNIDDVLPTIFESQEKICDNNPSKNNPGESEES